MRNIETWEKKIRDSKIKELPPRFQRDLKTISPPILPEGESFYLYGAQNSGKSVESCFILLEEYKSVYLEGGPSNPLDNAEFTTVADLINLFHKCYEKNYDGQSESSLLEHYQNIRFLVLDDIGTVKPTDWTLHLLYSIIDHRYNYFKRTVITSNLSLRELAQVLGDSRITSRIDRMCKVIQCKKIY